MNSDRLSFGPRNIPGQRVALFIDGNNMLHTFWRLGFYPDWKRILEFFTRDSILVRAFYYISLLPEGAPEWLDKTLEWMRFNGYTVITKEAKQRTRNLLSVSGEEVVVEVLKGDMDVDLAVDMLSLVDRYDKAILFTGDGDMRRLVEAVQQKGARVLLVSTRQLYPRPVSDDLLRQADEFVDLADIREQIERKQLESFGQVTA